MPYIATGFAFGLAWAAVQLLRGAVSHPVEAAVPVVLCAAFGAGLWGLRALALFLVRRARSAR